MLSVHHRRERFTAVARMGRKGDKNVIPRACSTKWVAFIAILICRGEDIFQQCLSVRTNTGVKGIHGLLCFTV